MKNCRLKQFAKPLAAIAVIAAAALSVSGCKSKDSGDGAPPPAQVIEVPDMNLITIDQNDLSKFPLAPVGEMQIPSELSATGSVFPDISREVPVISLANGRVVGIKVRLDDNVKKGELLFQVQSPDVTNAYDAYLKTVNDEQLARKNWIRAQDLLNHGAISQAMADQADDTEKDAKADLNAAELQLKMLGVDKDRPTDVMNVCAPVSGVVIGQNVTNSAAAGVNLSGSSTAFTIADLSHVWILCDVYENDIPKLQLGQRARIVLNAYPDRPLSGRIGDIGPVLDPSLRTAKVRIELENPGFLKLGMFATATFTSSTKQTVSVVPADAVLHLHDRNWVYEPAGGNHFRRTEVHAGAMLPGQRQQVLFLTPIQPGQQVVTNALLIDAAGNQ
ncbi:MAG: efflux RND transporter periplasmic adaptor subunit [Terracidiphilus sp.]